jgi:fructokinase
MRLGVETGGTKILARLTSTDGEILADGRWPTTTPQAAADAIVAFVGQARPSARLEGVGLAAFGPLLVDPQDPDQGLMLPTTKSGWTGSNLRLALSRRLDAPVRVDTDVNAAALAELAMGAGKGLPSLAYLTVGTGIGGGLATTTGTLRGALHSEVGHLRVVRAHSDALISTCPFHADCAEGLAAGPALAERLCGARLDSRPEVAGLVADYVAQLAVSLVLAWSPHRIAIGGGVGTACGMLEAVRSAFVRALGSYGVGPAPRAEDFIVRPVLADAGLEGALLMAAQAEI